MNRSWDVTPEQVAEAKRLRYMSNGRPKCWRKIAQAMGLSNHKLQMAMNPYYKRNHNTGTTHKASPLVTRMQVPEEVLEERQRRQDAPYRTAYSAMLGEPPVGYSALDRR